MESTSHKATAALKSESSIFNFLISSATLCKCFWNHFPLTGKKRLNSLAFMAAVFNGLNFFRTVRMLRGICVHGDTLNTLVDIIIILLCICNLVCVPTRYCIIVFIYKRLHICSTILTPVLQSIVAYQRSACFARLYKSIFSSKCHWLLPNHQKHN